MAHIDEKWSTEIMNLWKVLRNHNKTHDPLIIVGENKYIEGYWFSSSERNYPFPNPTDVKVDDVFLQKLKNIMNKFESIQYLGVSKCRLCDVANGHREYKIISNGIEFTFPQGILHYYETHNVQPSEKFCDFIMKLDIEK